MVIKHTEFMKLTQGNKSLNEYLQAFNNLARYATEFVDTDAKKIASFKRGLSPKLSRRSPGRWSCDGSTRCLQGLGAGVLHMWPSYLQSNGAIQTFALSCSTIHQLVMVLLPL